MPLSPDKHAIQIKVDEVSQLFNTLDPFPFRERDLDKDAEEFIVGWARELPKAQPITVVIHVSEAEAKRDPAHQVKEALNRYFAYREGTLSLDLKELFRVGRSSLISALSSGLRARNTNSMKSPGGC